MPLFLKRFCSLIRAQYKIFFPFGVDRDASQTYKDAESAAPHFYLSRLGGHFTAGAMTVHKILAVLATSGGNQKCRKKAGGSPLPPSCLSPGEKETAFTCAVKKAKLVELG